MINSDDLRTRIMKGILGLFKEIVTLKPPFDKFPFSKFDPEMLSFYNNSDQLIKEKLMNGLIESQKSILGLIKNLDEDAINFYNQTNWEINSKIDPKPIEGTLEDKPVKKKSLLKKIVKNRLPHFLYNKSISRLHYEAFSCMYREKEIIVIFDTGKMLKKVRLMIGMINPQFQFYLQTLFPGTIKGLYYDNPKEYIAAVNKNIDILEIIYPYFLKILDNALENNK